MRRGLIALVGLMLVATSCLGGGSQMRTVLVDHEHDVFASSMLAFFPNRVEATPGDTVVFRQTWTGEPHSVTMGRYIDKYGALLKPFLKIFEAKGEKALPPEPKKLEDFDNSLVWMVNDNGTVAQNGAQPCFLRKGLPPKKANQACTKPQQRQPTFDGTYNYYNSGFIPYQGTGSNTFSIKIAADAKPGEHFFYCNYHGPLMSGWLTIKPKGSAITPQNELSARALKQIEKKSTPLLAQFRRAQGGLVVPPKDAVSDLKRFGLTRKKNGKTYFKGWFAGLGDDNVDQAFIDEFVPKRITAKVGQKLRWLVLGSHTISFNVPKYFPIIRIAKSGRVTLNPKIVPPAGGAPDISTLGETHQNGPPNIDAGKWDGKGFWSSGFIESDNFAVYSLRITKPGTYKFACLIHPPMVGTVTVTR
jgi:plastocyanin